MKLYVRCGDGDDYHGFSTIEEVADHLGSFGVPPPVDRCLNQWFMALFGIGAVGFRNQNYISLYWGTDVETPLASITDAELARLNEVLAGEGAIHE